MVQTSTSGTVHNGQSADSPTGWDLVTAAQQGDREAFGQLYQRYADGVSRLVLSRTGDRHLAQDLASETFLRGLRRIDSVSDQGRDVGAWFTTIARNLVADHWKSHRYQREQTTADFTDTGPAHDDSGPEQVVIARETAADVRRRVEQLPPDQRECLRLRFWQDLSTAQTAAAMGRSENAVKALRHRAVETLRATLADARADDGAAGPAPRDRPDSLAQARRAVAEVAHHVAGEDQEAAEHARAQQLARWHADDRTTTREVDGAGLGAAPAEGRGVA